MEDLSPRMDHSEFVDTAVGVMPALQVPGKAMDASRPEKPLAELIKLRASQINGCAFRVQFHLNLARKPCVAPTKLDLVAVWHDTPVVFIPYECAALTWVEVLTTSARAVDHGVEDHEYDVVSEYFSRTEIASLTATVTNIQAWNRIAVAVRFVLQTPVAVTAEQA